MMNSILENLRFTGSPHVSLTPSQLKVLQRLKEKIASGMYRFEDIPCLCGSKDERLLAGTDRYGLKVSIVACTVCGLVRMNPRLDASSLERFYREEYRDLYMGPEYGSMDNYFQGMIGRGEVIVSTIEMHAPALDWKSAKVLEVGCSAGGILVPFLRRGCRVRGYDYDARYLEYGMKKFPKLDLRVGGVEELMSDTAYYDIVIFNHALEHLSDPRHAVQLAEDRLAPGGILYVSVPGLRNPEFYFSPTKSFIGGLHIAHLYYFTATTLRNAMPGFTPVFVDETICAIMKKSDLPLTMTSVYLHNEFLRTVSFINAYEANVTARLWYIFSRNVLRYGRGGVNFMKNILKRVFNSICLRLTDVFLFCRCWKPELRWLYKNRSLRMDANIALNDKRRRDFHIDRYEFAAQYIKEKYGSSLSILDAACGTGYGSHILKKCSPAKLVGVDICSEAISYAQKKYGEAGYNFQCADVTRFDGFKPETFDAVVSFETIEHLEEPPLFLEKVYKLLKRDGALIISTPNKWGKTKDHRFDYDYDLLREHLSKFFEIEDMFIQNSGCMELWINRGQPRRLIRDSEAERETAECFIAVGIKR